MFLNVDTHANRFVLDFTSTEPLSPADISKYKHTAKIEFSVRLLDRVYFGLGDSAENAFRPFTVRALAGAFIGLDLLSSDGATLLARNDSAWTIGADNVGRGVLDLNTVNMDTYFNAVAFKGDKQAVLVLCVQLGDYDAELYLDLTLRKTMCPSGTPTPVGSDVYLTQAQLEALYVKYVGNPKGASINLESITTGKHVVIGCNEDGSLAVDSY